MSVSNQCSGRPAFALLFDSYTLLADASTQVGLKQTLLDFTCDLAKQFVGQNLFAHRSNDLVLKTLLWVGMVKV